MLLSTFETQAPLLENTIDKTKLKCLHEKRGLLMYPWEIF